MLSLVGLLSVQALTANVDTAADFAAWKLKYGKTYAETSAEQIAFQKFATNDQVIRTHNALRLSYTLGHNQFSDMTHEEARTPCYKDNKSIED